MADDGGQAFPIQIREFDGIMGPGWHMRTIPGMSLLDYFAAQALIGTMIGLGGNLDAAQATREAYEYADAMLAERAK